MLSLPSPSPASSPSSASGSRCHFPHFRDENTKALEKRSNLFRTSNLEPRISRLRGGAGALRAPGRPSPAPESLSPLFTAASTACASPLSLVCRTRGERQSPWHPQECSDHTGLRIVADISHSRKEREYRVAEAAGDLESKPDSVTPQGRGLHKLPWLLPL